MNHPLPRIVLSIALIGLGGAVALGADMPGSQPPADPSGAPSAVPASPVVVGDLSVEGAWARVSPMVERAGAAYLVIRSRGATDDALVGATSPAAAVVEMHQTVAGEDGMMTMRPVPAIPVPAGGMVELVPGGYHLMLIDLVEPLAEGMDVELALTFQSGVVITVHAPVRPMVPMGSPMPMGSPASMGSPAPMGSPAS